MRESHQRCCQHRTEGFFDDSNFHLKSPELNDIEKYYGLEIAQDQSLAGLSQEMV